MSVQMRYPYWRPCCLRTIEQDSPSPQEGDRHLCVGCWREFRFHDGMWDGAVIRGIDVFGKLLAQDMRTAATQREKDFKILRKEG